MQSSFAPYFRFALIVVLIPFPFPVTSCSWKLENVLSEWVCVCVCVCVSVSRARDAMLNRLIQKRSSPLRFRSNDRRAEPSGKIANKPGVRKCFEVQSEEIMSRARRRFFVFFLCSCVPIYIYIYYYTRVYTRRVIKTPLLRFFSGPLSCKILRICGPGKAKRRAAHSIRSVRRTIFANIPRRGKINSHRSTLASATLRPSFSSDAVLLSKL